MEVLNSKVKLEIIDLCKKFDDNKERTLENVSFTVYDGEFLSILGPSGCGKTTILRILIGLLKATSGKVLMEGRDITDLPPAARGMGIVFQNYALFENMTVLENVSYALKIKKETRADADKNVRSQSRRATVVSALHSDASADKQSQQDSDGNADQIKFCQGFNNIFQEFQSSQSR